jgi:two-component system, response regulator YesN
MIKAEQILDAKERTGLKILIVDDEAPARKSLFDSINNMGYTDIISAENGSEAYNIILSSKPDIVLADIRMPGMDGIELLSRVKETLEGTLFIFISGFDLFEYAQKAIALGAFSYLLKPINDNDLWLVIEKSIEKLTRQNRQQELHTMTKIRMNQGLEFMRQHFIHELISKNTYSDAYLKYKLGDLDIHFMSDSFCVMIVSIDDRETVDSAMSPKDMELLDFSIDNISGEVITDNNIRLYQFYTNDDHGYLLNFSDGFASDYIYLYDMCHTIIKNINRILNINVTIGIGKTVNGINNLGESYEYAQKSVMQRLVKGSNQIYIEEDSNTKENIQFIGHKAEQEMLSYFERCDIKSAMNLLERFYSTFTASGIIDTKNLMKLNLQLILLIYKLLDQMDVNAEKTLGDEFMLYNQVNSCKNIQAMIDFLEEKICLCFNSILSAREKNARKVLEKAKEYIHQNLTSGITLGAVADHIHLSPTYFSKLFKQETGENFVDYVVGCRINKARELLSEGTYKASAICKLSGFNDVKHFYKVFKKLTGFSPKEYKRL